MSDYPTLPDMIAAGIQGYAAGEGGRYSYHGDGSAIEAMERLDKESHGLGRYISEGWVKSRTIETVEQLDALPDGSVINVPDKRTVSSVEKFMGVWWPNRGSGQFPGPRRVELLPARLLYHPEVDHG